MRGGAWGFVGGLVLDWCFPGPPVLRFFPLPSAFRTPWMWACGMRGYFTMDLGECKNFVWLLFGIGFARALRGEGRWV